MIQQAAGVSKSTVYSHYPNKEALFVAVVEAECERFLRAVRKPKFPEERLADILNAMALAYLEIVLSRDGLALYRMIAAEAPRFPELGRRFLSGRPCRHKQHRCGDLGSRCLEGRIGSWKYRIRLRGLIVREHGAR